MDCPRPQLLRSWSPPLTTFPRYPGDKPCPDHPLSPHSVTATISILGPIMINHKVLSKSPLLQGVVMYCSLSVLQCLAIYIYAGEVAGFVKGSDDLLNKRPGNMESHLLQPFFTQMRHTFWQVSLCEYGENRAQ